MGSEQSKEQDPYVSHMMRMLDEVVALHRAAISIQSNIRGTAARAIILRAPSDSDAGTTSGDSPSAAKVFARLDKNEDGLLSKIELIKAIRKGDSKICRIFNLD